MSKRTRAEYNQSGSWLDLFQKGKRAEIRNPRVVGERCPDSTLGMLIFLSDQPFIASGTIECVLNEAQKPADPNIKRVIQPIFREQKGHPVFFSRSMLVHFSELKGDVGAKTIMKHAYEHVLVPKMKEPCWTWIRWRI